VIEHVLRRHRLGLIVRDAGQHGIERHPALPVLLTKRGDHFGGAGRLDLRARRRAGEHHPERQQQRSIDYGSARHYAFAIDVSPPM
jgi:hypothetical protein